ncbi:MAG: hypothetical protein K6V97_07070 [Actinomycetia bacterium]|nr:hypothetical protein [Actinomycetes bacterium]
MDVVDKIAELIRTDPSISVKELARRLGYAEEKTIYYWINKRGFRGIRPFKRAVLTGQFRSAAAAREPALRPGRLPVAERLSATGDPVYTGETLPVTLDRGRGLFVLHYRGDAVDAFLPGDYLVVGPVDLTQAEWVVVARPPGSAALRRVVRTAAGPLLVDWHSAEVDRDARPVGTVLEILRLLRPVRPD